MGAMTAGKADSTYDALIEFMLQNCQAAKGDILEIGAFCGHFTRILAEAFSDRMVYAVDVFDPTYDEHTMGDRYTTWLDGQDQLTVYRKNIAKHENVITIMCDSANLYKCALFSGPIKIAYIDGGHSFASVSKDFGFVWARLPIGGLAVFDDYDYDLPGVTDAIDGCVKVLRSDGKKYTTWRLENLKSFAIRKEQCGDD